MSNTTIRLLVAALLVAVVYGGNYLVQAGKTVPKVDLPDWSLSEMPRQFGRWQGDDTELDPRVFIATQAKAVSNRLYRHANGRTVSLHSAIFDDPDAGAYHSPGNCYRAAGWRPVDSSDAKLEVAGKLPIDVKIVTYERNQEKILILYWYQLGEHTLFGRFDLGKIRWAMRGRDSWPALIKVLMQTPANDPDEARTQLLELAGYVHQWIDEKNRQPASAGAKK